MDTQYVRACFDIDCEWEGLPPVYRVYVNDEMFTEREWRWTDCYLTEILQIQASPGEYQIKIQSVGPNLAKFTVGNHRVEWGKARWRDQQRLEILA